MTTLPEAREAVYQRFVDNYAATPVTFENEKFDAPEVNWVRLTVRQLSANQETLGSIGTRRYRRRASVIAQVFTQADNGLSDGDVLSQQILSIFEGTSFSDLDFNDGVIREVGVDGRWFQHNVEAFFDYDEIK